MPYDASVIERIRGRLLTAPEPIEEPMAPDWVPDVPFDRPPVSAAVLLAIVRRGDAPLSMLYTERASTLRAHSGQISFPGGRVEPTDAGPGDAALREAAEEVALVPGEARVLGYLPRYYTGTNYIITPVVAVVEPSGPFVPNPDEVSSVFEVPLAWLIDQRNFGTYRIQRRGVEHTTWQVEHSGLVIWGITGNLTRTFHDVALTGEAAW